MTTSFHGLFIIVMDCKEYDFIGMETGSSTSFQSKQGSRRVWTKQEDETLLNILDEAVAHD